MERDVRAQRFPILAVASVATLGFYALWYLYGSIRELERHFQSREGGGSLARSRDLLVAFIVAMAFAIPITVSLQFAMGGLAKLLADLGFLVAIKVLAASLLAGFFFLVVFEALGGCLRALNLDGHHGVPPWIVALITIGLGVAAALVAVYAGAMGRVLGVWFLLVLELGMVAGWMVLLYLFHAATRKLWGALGAKTAA